MVVAAGQCGAGQLLESGPAQLVKPAGGGCTSPARIPLPPPPLGAPRPRPGRGSRQQMGTCSPVCLRVRPAPAPLQAAVCPSVRLEVRLLQIWLANFFLPFGEGNFFANVFQHRQPILLAGLQNLSHLKLQEQQQRERQQQQATSRRM